MRIHIHSVLRSLVVPQASLIISWRHLCIRDVSLSLRQLARYGLSIHGRIMLLICGGVDFL